MTVTNLSVPTLGSFTVTLLDTKVCAPIKPPIFKVPFPPVVPPSYVLVPDKLSGAGVIVALLLVLAPVKVGTI